MLRYMRSLILGILLGTVVGLYFGWELFPSGGRNSELSQLARSDQDDYTVMIAAGYAVDNDSAGAIERLRLLGHEDLPRALRESTERIISSSSRSLADIRLLVGLAHGLGLLSAPMQPFLNLDGGAG